MEEEDQLFSILPSTLSLSDSLLNTNDKINTHVALNLPALPYVLDV